VKTHSGTFSGSQGKLAAPIGWAMAMTWLFMGVTNQWEFFSPRGTPPPGSGAAGKNSAERQQRRHVRHAATSPTTHIIGTCSSDVLEGFAFGNASLYSEPFNITRLFLCVLLT